MNIIRFRPPRIALAFILLATAVHCLLSFAWDGYRLQSTVLGAAIATGGFVLMISGWNLFRRRGVAVCPTEKTGRLITDGPYRRTRNPMYLGIVLMLIGAAAIVGTPPFYFMAAAYFAVINWGFCPYEEAKLEDSFGQEYLNYKRKVRRWL